MPLADLDVLVTAARLPALTPLESAIGQAWLKEHQAEYDQVDFNVRLGEGIQLPPGSPEFMQRYARASTTKRADMILRAGSVATIVEIKIRIGAGALGQLQVYRDLYAAQTPEVSDVVLIAIGQSIEPDIRAILAGAGISVELFPLAAPIGS